MLPFSRRHDTRCEHTRFVVQKPLLGWQSAAEPGQRTVRADDSMAGKDDADWISPVCRPQRPRSLRYAKLGSLPAITRRRAEGDVGQRAPGGKLKACALQIERDIERRT